MYSLSSNAFRKDSSAQLSGFRARSHELRGFCRAGHAVAPVGTKGHTHFQPSHKVDPQKAPTAYHDPRPPEILRAIGRDRSRGPYMGTSRRFGRGTGWDKGTHEVAFDDGPARNSHMRRDTWYTTAYTMSALSLDPGRDYIQLIDQSRVMGVTFANDIDDRLVVFAGNAPAVKKVEYKMPTSNGVNGDAYKYWSNSKTLPSINGKTLGLNPPMTYDVPYLKMTHGTDGATISYPGHPDLVIGHRSPLAPRTRHSHLDMTRQGARTRVQ